MKLNFDALIPIFERDSYLSFYMELESELYADGKDRILLIDKDYLLVINEDFEAADEKEINRCMERGEAYNGALPASEDWERFYMLDEMQQGKELYIASDILRYVDQEYIAETPQVEALRRFLVKEVELEILAEIQTEAKTWSEKKKKSELAALRGEAAKTAILEMHRLICDVSVSPTETFPAVMKSMEGFGYQFTGMDQITRFMELFTEMSNNTRMPSNRGFTPVEMMKKMRCAPQAIEFGSGIVNSIRQGEIDGNELKKLIMGDSGMPMELRASLLREVNRAMGKGERGNKTEE